MASVLQIVPPDAVRRIQRVQTVTIAWMSVEALVSLFAAWRARSPALLAFGGDSAIEFFSAVVVLWRFLATDAHEDVEKRAASVAGALLFALAAFVAISYIYKPSNSRLTIPKCLVIIMTISHIWLQVVYEHSSCSPNSSLRETSPLRGSGTAPAARC